MNNSNEIILNNKTFKIGDSIGTTDWLQVSQTDINVFAAVSRDMDPLHIDPNAAAQGPFGHTIAFGFYTLSLLTYFSHELSRWEDIGAGLNYGFDKIRFLAPVPVGARLRAHFILAGLEQKSKGTLITYSVKIEIEGEPTPALVAEWLGLLLT
ncbi:MAG: MaoC family dehydratase [Cellvibrionaceae bacterium]|nr:MaoC family dehydratase [Cellvibrionaceae bacterium]